MLLLKRNLILRQWDIVKSGCFKLYLLIGYIVLLLITTHVILTIILYCFNELRFYILKFAGEIIHFIYNAHFWRNYCLIKLEWLSFITYLIFIKLDLIIKAAIILKINNRHDPRKLCIFWRFYLVNSCNRIST